MKNNPLENAKVAAASRLPAKRGVRVEVQDLSKSYAGREVLKSVALHIEAGEFVAIVGRSGCGKSTLLRLLAGLEHADGGRIAFGESTESKPQTRIMFQDSRLLPWKRVLDNVALGLQAASGKAVQALQNVGLQERAKEWPAVLSGGQRQRVALARALVHDPELLLLDEPLGALDALTRIEMQQLIETLWRERGFTAVLVTHDVQEAIALADRVILIEDGRITLDERIDLQRPRSRGNAAFAQWEERILARVLQHPASAPDEVLGDVSLLKTVTQVAWAI
ncbi:ATP-binding cassette domain-containing protein [Noviherbaspirillum cavernae]|uniref:ATP-binding cassette domain-containing protein n=1 Tax=Noviherbaspirillum cavernae TaxID=2320862 RepID=A0A418X5Z7_9BURK|nr:ATP-binding cassette domain-containing protein [Noviherbaspirillum cavernae]RJG07859.1 ATP-binding cassette domain-containing protein [Noviherbaspirillum cavernae]